MTSKAYTLWSAEAGRILGVSSVTMRRYAQAGKIPHIVTPGGRHRFNRADVRKLKEALEHG